MYNFKLYKKRAVYVSNLKITYETAPFYISSIELRIFF